MIFKLLRETKYPAIKLELMAIVYGVQAFHYYLDARKFIILSDSTQLNYSEIHISIFYILISEKSVKKTCQRNRAK